MENKKDYLAPYLKVLQIQSGLVLAASGNSTSVFDDGGSLPGWDNDNGNTTSPFRDGGSLPDYD